jgi:hypothetical protein
MHPLRPAQPDVAVLAGHGTAAGLGPVQLLLLGPAMLLLLLLLPLLRMALLPVHSLVVQHTPHHTQAPLQLQSQEWMP